MVEAGTESQVHRQGQGLSAEIYEEHEISMCEDNRSGSSGKLERGGKQEEGEGKGQGTAFIL